MPSLTSSPGKMNQCVTAPGRFERVPRFDNFYCESPVVSTRLSCFFASSVGPTPSIRSGVFRSHKLDRLGSRSLNRLSRRIVSQIIQASQRRSPRPSQRCPGPPVSACLVADRVEDQAMGRVTDGHLVGHAEWADSSGSLACHRREWVAHPKNKWN